MATERDLPAYLSSELEADVVRPALLYEGEFLTVGGTVQYLRLWSGYGTLSWNGADWLGEGRLMGFSPIEETQDLKAAGFQVSISGQYSDHIALALSTSQLSQGRSGKIWLAFFDEDGQTMLVEPLLLKRGKLDTVTTEDRGGDATIAAQYEEQLVRLRSSNGRRWTHDDQQIDYPGDRGFEYVAALQDAPIHWGGQASAASALRNALKNGRTR